MTPAAPEQKSADAPLMLSVSGMRGIVGKTITPDRVALYGAAFATHLKHATGDTNPVVCVGRDSRTSGELFAAAAMSGLAACGAAVVDLGVVATPTAGLMIGRHEAAGGLVITASHNPLPWNGVKSLDARGVALPVDEANALIARFRNAKVDYVEPTAIKAMSSDASGPRTHADLVAGLYDANTIKQKKLSVVVDSVCGAGGDAARLLLERFDCRVDHLHAAPTGLFPHVPEPVQENLTELADRVRATDAACGFAQDPDADRLAIVDENGRYIGEEYTLVLATKYMLDTQGAGTIAANLSTSRMIDDLAARYDGARVVRTAVGEANVVAGMQENDAMLGGEGNGGVIDPRVCWVRDSLSAMAMTLSVLVREQKSLSAIVDELPRYAMIKRKFDLTDVGGADAVPEMLDRVKTAYADQRVNDIDGVRVDFQSGWVHLRPSNTEPILRIIAESDSDDAAQKLIDDVARAAKLTV